jgi:hypothetical protein
VKRWHYFALAAAVAAAAFYGYTRRESLGSLTHQLRASAGGAESESARPAKMNWQPVDRPMDGFKVELPSEPKDLAGQAFNETGGAEAIHMIAATPDDDTYFAVTWQDNPPVARVNNDAPASTLNMARDGMLARTQTTIVSQSLSLQRRNPSLDVSARNGGGGILDARLILAGNRLYVLMALFPSTSARRERDVARFFDSFVPGRPAVISETMPAASHN